MWYLKQLFPLQYNTTYREEGMKKLAIWRMWLGRCFSVKTYTILEADK